MSRGFTIVELLVIGAIIATFSVVLVLNFRSSPKNRIARNQTAAVIISDIRRMQTMASAGSRYQGNIVCGYGIHYVGDTSYSLYAKAVPLTGGPCSSLTTRNYEAGDIVVETKNLINANMEIRAVFKDIFFEPPDPKTYINNDPSLAAGSTTVTIQLKNQLNCAQQTCTQITVYTSGRVDLTN